MSEAYGTELLRRQLNGKLSGALLFFNFSRRQRVESVLKATRANFGGMCLSSSIAFSSF